MDKYKLISTFDSNDSIEFDVDLRTENPETRALDELGWFVVKKLPEEEQN